MRHCKNCSWFKREDYSHNYYCFVISKKHVKKQVNKITGVDESFYLSPQQIANVAHNFQVCDVLNGKNNCSYYSRKWYLFLAFWIER